MKFLQLNFLPRSSDTALLLLRIWFGASMLLLHGWGKLTGFSGMSGKFLDPFGIGQTPTLALVVFAEVVCAALIVVGLFTRVSALVAAINMGFAFWLGHGGKLSGPGSGEMAFLFFGAYFALFLAGAGKFSLDAKMGARA